MLSLSVMSSIEKMFKPFDNLHGGLSSGSLHGSLGVGGAWGVGGAGIEILLRIVKK